MTLGDDVETFLLEDRVACIEYDDGPGPSDEAIAAAKRIIDDLGDLLPGTSDKFLAAFGEEDGYVALVLSLERRVDLRIWPDGLGLTVITINERLKSQSTDTTTDDRAMIRGCVKWVLA